MESTNLSRIYTAFIYSLSWMHLSKHKNIFYFLEQQLPTKKVITAKDAVKYLGDQLATIYTLFAFCISRMYTIWLLNNYKRGLLTILSMSITNIISVRRSYQCAGLWKLGRFQRRFLSKQWPWKLPFISPRYPTLQGIFESYSLRLEQQQFFAPRFQYYRFEIKAVWSIPEFDIPGILIFFTNCSCVRE